ncbi:PREDICTED: putative F-box protein At3g16820 [Camelina sativa]|uniref:F-box protein At3g16820 n=1 Tax=Camelina sativa TaxID=90675 RepID=A0ABM1R9Z8_CAMSA|nr:PREDICTED: putative F-box protein At3g16820 [Camelina sativa]
MTMIIDLSRDLMEEILSRVPITSLPAVRSACKGWNGLSKDKSFTKKYSSDKAAKEFLLIMFYDSRVSLIGVNLHEMFNHEELFDTSCCIKKIGNLPNQVVISEVFECDGLLLCVTKGMPRLVAWNPYLGQVRWILARRKFHILDKFAIGYDNSNRNSNVYKILWFWFRYEHITNKRITDCEIYRFKSNSWKVLDVFPSDCDIESHQCSVSLKGNTYFVARQSFGEKKYGLVCFDFTRERFGPHLHLPFDYGVKDIVTLSSVREEQLAVLLKRSRDTYEMEIWITTNIEPNTVSWRKFLAVKDESILNPIRYIALERCSFFVIDEERKAVVVCVKDKEKRTTNVAYVIREDGCYKEMLLGQSNHLPLMCSYVPSSVQIHHKGPVPAGGKRKKLEY